jgi:hypothetical protein
LKQIIKAEFVDDGKEFFDCESGLQFNRRMPIVGGLQK